MIPGSNGKGAKTEAKPEQSLRRPLGGLAGWLLMRLRVVRRAAPRLAVLERIALAPRQSLALVEAEGRRFLVATSPEGTPAFYALDEPGPKAARRQQAASGLQTASVRWNPAAFPRSGSAAPAAGERSARVSW
jgi:flagellar biogenesis protein FliO